MIVHMTPLVYIGDMDDTDKTKPLLVKPAEAARLLDCSRAFIYKLMDTGLLANLKIGNTRRIPMTEIERIAKEGA